MFFTLSDILNYTFAEDISISLERNGL